MQAVWGADQGYTSAVAQRERLVKGIRKVRAELDAFDPNFVLIWGDDQYEKFKEDIIPPFCFLAYEDMVCRPFTNKDGSPRRNVWDEPADKAFKYRGHPEAARSMVSNLIEQGFDLPYAYKPLHETWATPSLTPSCIWTMTKIFDYPVLPSPSTATAAG